MAERQTLDIRNPGPDLPAWAEPARGIGQSILANPLPVVIGIAVVLVCLAAGGAIQLSRMAAEADAATAYANAVFEEDEEARYTALETASKYDSPWGVEALYLLGEEAIAKSEWDKARTAFEQVVSNHADSPLAPRAAEGLAFIDEANGAYEQALEGYRKVAANWPDSFAGRCQPYNIARVLETLGQMRDAVASYKNQAVVFKDSKIAEEANTALDRLRISHPDLFADEAAAEAAPVVDGAAAPATEAASAEAAPATTEPAAASEAPAPAADAAEPVAETPAAEPAPAAAQ
jgi:tetratricopeptide (TPR) repeat protein